MATTGPDAEFFFSYSRVDSEFVLRLAHELRAAGSSVWVDQLDILGGERWDEAVERALRGCPGMVLVLSPDAVKSQNFLDEVSYALEEGKQIIPVLFRQCELPFRLRRLHYVDFTGDYRTGFDHLRRALALDPGASPQAVPPAPEVDRIAEPQGGRRRPQSTDGQRATPAGAPAVAFWRLGVVAAPLVLFYLFAIPESCFHPDWVVLSAVVGLPLFLLIKRKRPRNSAWLLLPAVTAVVGVPYGHAYGSMERSALFGLEVGESCQPFTATYSVLFALLLAVVVLDHWLLRRARVPRERG